MLLFSSITYGFAMLEMDKNDQRKTQMWLAVTGLFGIAFVALEIREFAHLPPRGRPPVAERLPVLVLHPGRDPRAARLVRHPLAHGPHGPGQRGGLIAANKRRLMCLSMFWHFLDLIWIGVFTVVYLMGVLE